MLYYAARDRFSGTRRCRDFKTDELEIFKLSTAWRESLTQFNSYQNLGLRPCDKNLPKICDSVRTMEIKTRNNRGTQLLRMGSLTGN